MRIALPWGFIPQDHQTQRGLRPPLGSSVAPDSTHLRDGRRRVSLHLPQSQLANRIRGGDAGTRFATKKPRGYEVESGFVDGTQHQPLSESKTIKTMEVLAKLMLPKKDEPD